MFGDGARRRLARFVAPEDGGEFLKVDREAGAFRIGKPFAGQIARKRLQERCDRRDFLGRPIEILKIAQLRRARRSPVADQFADGALHLVQPTHDFAQFAANSA